MGRSRKFELGDVAYYRSVFVVIVDYRQDTRGRGEYRVVRVQHPFNGSAYGDSVWIPPHLLLKTDYNPRPNTVRVYRANLRMEHRGCACNCCPHEAIPRSDINADGTFVWD